MISIVIPLYNKVQHIKRTLDSVLAQTYQDFEVIVVNDGSTDGSEKIVAQYADPRIRLINQENKGAAVARNRGVAEAKGDLIAFLDADDEWLPHHLETIMRLRQAHPDAGAWSTAWVRIVGNRLSGPVNVNNMKIIKGDSNSAIIDIFQGSKPLYLPFCTNTIVIKKDVLLSIGGFPEGIAKSQDGDTWLRLAFHYPIAWSSIPTALIHTDGENHVATGKYIWMGIPPFFKSLCGLVREKGGWNNVRKEIVHYVMKLHRNAYITNILAGNKKAAMQIAADFRSVKGHRLKGYLLLLLLPVAYVPPGIIDWLWRIRRSIKTRIPMSNGPVIRRSYIREDFKDAQEN
ncbi:MAG: glycosyltransferase family 2 protein [candidate division WOR-3 bacterium]